MIWLLEVIPLSKNINELLITFCGVAASIVTFISYLKEIKLHRSIRLSFLFVAMLMWLSTLIFLASFAIDSYNICFLYIIRFGFFIISFASLCFFLLMFFLISRV